MSLRICRYGHLTGYRHCPSCVTFDSFYRALFSSHNRQRQQLAPEPARSRVQLALSPRRTPWVMRAINWIRGKR